MVCSGWVFGGHLTSVSAHCHWRCFPVVLSILSLFITLATITYENNYIHYLPNQMTNEKNHNSYTQYRSEVKRREGREGKETELKFFISSCSSIDHDEHLRVHLGISSLFTIVYVCLYLPMLSICCRKWIL